MEYIFNNKYAFIFVLTRISMILSFGVFFSDKRISKKIKIGLVMLMAVLLTPNVPYVYGNSISQLEFTKILLSEVILGIVIGFVSNMLVNIMSTAGSIIDMQGGFSMAQIYDPTTQTQVSLTSKLFLTITLLCFVFNDLHITFLDIVMNLFEVIPIGSVLQYNSLLRLLTTCITISACIALPVISVIFIVDSILGVATKTLPQLNLFSVGYIVKVVLTLILLYFYTLILNGLILSVTDMLFSFIKNLS